MATVDFLDDKPSKVHSGLEERRPSKSSRDGSEIDLHMKPGQLRPNDPAYVKHDLKDLDQDIQRVISKQSSGKDHHSDGHGGGGDHDDHGHGHEMVEKFDLDEKDKYLAGVVWAISLGIVITMIIWASQGLMAPHALVHAVSTNTRPGHMHATLYRTPIDIVLHGTETQFFEVRFIAMSTKDFSAHHRRLQSDGPRHSLASRGSGRMLSHLSGQAKSTPRPMPTVRATPAPTTTHAVAHDSGHALDHGGEVASSGHSDGHAAATTHSTGGHSAATTHAPTHADTHAPTGHDAHAADGHTGANSHATDGHAADGHAADGHATDGHVADGHATGGHAADGAHGASSGHGATAGNHTGHGNATSGSAGDGHASAGHGAATGHGTLSGHGTSSGHATPTATGQGIPTGNGHGDDHGDGHAVAGHGHGGHGHKGPVTGTLQYQLFVDGRNFYNKTFDLSKFKIEEEYEDFTPIDLAEYGGAGGKVYMMRVISERDDGLETGFLLQVVRMNSMGKYREVIGIIIFVVCFVSILAEKIHRVYSAMLGAAAAMCAVCAIQETLHLEAVMAMIDFGTLMLLFSMMILMKMLQETGFFNWFAIKVVGWSRQDPKILFFMLTNICGFLSMFLDNVTTVMLFGPLTYSLCAQMGLNPRPLYLSMAICATIGGTATQIGDPPNIVIGSKLQINFATFLKYNFPVIGFAGLPAASAFLFWRLKDQIITGEVKQLDLKEVEKDNRITDMPKFAQLAGILFAVFCALITAPVHHIEPAWFTVMAMWASAILFMPHSIHHYLMAVEWDTLFFFACLFTLVECLSELNVIKMLGGLVASLIMQFPEDYRLSLSIIMLLWVCSYGSAFLESLPFTTTIVYVLLDMRQQDIPGLDPNVLVWPLSVGACVGGIGSIMGSSANLVSMAVSNRQARSEEEKIQGSDFLKHGLPTMHVVVSICMVWQLFIFQILGLPPA